ncbi:MAG: esterase-like activity of phytase family protein [Amaricoccus sp.]|uniref:esterase-like activity of phytase family protein n=1 Tax=Amaricoccus sp. TaxID=1872485 RepID=UPI0039E23FDB
MRRRFRLCVALVALALPGIAPVVLPASEAAVPAGAPHLVEMSRTAWRDGWVHFGGFSALWVSPDGSRFTVISDRGAFADGHFERTDGEIDAAVMGRHARLRGIDGVRLEGPDVDAEGLALDRDGRAYVSFENFHRVRRYDDLRGPAASVPSHPDFARFQQNSGIETLAMDAAGTLYAIPERSGGLRRPFPVYRLIGDAWDKSWTIPREGTFVPVDADFGPDGRFYLLERDFKWLGGFATRIRRFDVTPEGLVNETELLQTRFGDLDNMEGLAAWRDPEGRTRLTLVSDDNFFPLQQTLFVEYVVEG